MKNTFALGLVTLSFLFLASGVKAQEGETIERETFLKLCNNTKDKVLSTAYALNDAKINTPSVGWVVLQPQGCSKVSLGAFVGKSYVYAEWNKGEVYWGSGPTNFCVNKEASFTLNNAFEGGKCEEKISQKMVPSFEFTLVNGTNTFTFNP